MSKLGIALSMFSLFLAGSGALVGVANARQPAEQSQIVRTVWVSKPDIVPGIVGPISSNNPIFNARLMPIELYQLDQTGEIEELGLALTAGTELVGVDAPVPTACAVDRLKGKARRAVKVKGHAFLCLVDQDTDGSFDAYFSQQSVRKDMPIFQTVMPNDLIAMPRVPFSEIDRSQLKFERYIYLFYAENHSLVNRFSFGVEIADNPYKSSYSRRLWLGYKDKDIPISDAILGVNFTILSKGKGGLTIRIASVDDQYPALLGTVCCVPNLGGFVTL